MRMADHLEERTFSLSDAKYMSARSYGASRGKMSRKEILSRQIRENKNKEGD